MASRFSCRSKAKYNPNLLIDRKFLKRFRIQHTNEDGTKILKDYLQLSESDLKELKSNLLGKKRWMDINTPRQPDPLLTNVINSIQDPNHKVDQLL